MDGVAPPRPFPSAGLVAVPPLMAETSNVDGLQAGGPTSPRQVSCTYASGNIAFGTIRFVASDAKAMKRPLKLNTGSELAPNGNSSEPVLSFNGRFIAFASEATNLIVPNAMFPEAYVHDTCLGDVGPPACSPSTLLVSAINGGTATSPAEGNGLGGATPSIGFQEFLSLPSGGIPPAGRYIGFLSTATNLVTPNTTLEQAYVRDNCLAGLLGPGCTPTTVLPSVTQSGDEPNGAASEFIFANNSCHAAFVSAGTDVVSGVTIPNEIYLTSCIANGPAGPFTTLTTAVSASTSGVPGDQGAQQPAISSDGRFVAFASTSTKLTSTPHGGGQQIYLRDTCTFAEAGL